MNKNMSSASILLIVLAGCTPSPEEASAPAGQPTSAGQSTPPEATVRIGSTTGVIESIDPDSKTVTISHEPVASLQWPAMTMTFKAPDADLSALQVGDRLRFDFTANGMDATITRIESAQ